MNERDPLRNPQDSIRKLDKGAEIALLDLRLCFMLEHDEQNVFLILLVTFIFSPHWTLLFCNPFFRLYFCSFFMFSSFLSLSILSSPLLSPVSLFILHFSYNLSKSVKQTSNKSLIEMREVDQQLGEINKMVEAAAIVANEVLRELMEK